MSGESTRPLQRVTDEEMTRMRGQLEMHGEITKLERRTLRGGREGLLVEVVAEGPDGLPAMAYTLYVPQGDRGFVMSYVVPGSSGDVGTWSMLVSSLQFPSTFKMPWKIVILGGMLAAFGLLMLYAKHNPAARRPSRSLADMGIEKPGTGAGAAGAPPASPFGSGASAGAVAEAAQPSVPGLRSTIAADGMWVDPEAGKEPEPSLAVPVRPDAPAAPAGKAASPSVPGLRSTLGNDGQWDESKSYSES